jgi:hypothetical protein
MRCKLCGKVVKVVNEYHCWIVAQHCGACHYFGGKKI